MEEHENSFLKLIPVYSPISPGVLGWTQMCDMFVASGERCIWGHTESHGYLWGCSPV